MKGRSVRRRQTYRRRPIVALMAIGLQIPVRLVDRSTSRLAA